jgi:hypothetical protein
MILLERMHPAWQLAVKVIRDRRICDVAYVDT